MNSSAIDLARLAAAPDLAMLLDLDGTLVPLADTPEQARLDDAAAELIRSLLGAGVRVVVVSGRLQGDLEPVRCRAADGAWWVAEHGGWRHADGAWMRLAGDHPELAQLGERLEELARSVVGGRVEHKSAGVCFHWRRVSEADRAELIDQVEEVVDAWLESHPEHERIGGVDLLEVRAREHHKGTAVRWVRDRLPGCPVIAIGDDLTDEDLFGALDPTDAAILVGRPGDRATCAGLAVDDVGGVHRLVRWILSVRTGATVAAPPVTVVAPPAAPPPARLLVMSNRTPAGGASAREREVGGLVAALTPALAERDGIWLGWSGQQREGGAALRVDRGASPVRACFDLTSRQRRLYYGGFCNRSLWPMLHGLPGRIRYEDADWREYQATNERFARLAGDLTQPDATIWIHDYHLLLAARYLRRRGHVGPIGLFLHVPFPAPELVETIPWARELVDGALACDLLGFQTAASADQFAESARRLLRADVQGERIHHAGRWSTARAFPIAIDARAFAPDGAPLAPEVEGLRAGLGDRRLLLGVDRLDYSKGVPERLQAFERLLESTPRWRGRVSLVQISVPSRADVPEYAELRARVEHLVGQINGRFGEADWVPVRYLYRSYDHRVLAQLYRLADVALVTPLRDGMNLVAKEFVAAQDPDHPGVLVLSRFAGAAEELDCAILTNPFHRDGLAADLDHALSMPGEERRARHQRLFAAVSRRSSTAWAREYLDALDVAHRRDHA